jgi:hypothetical protein
MSAERVDYDRLEEEAESLASLLKAREPGLSTWNTMLQQRVRSILETVLSEDEIDLLKLYEQLKKDSPSVVHKNLLLRGG